MDAECRQSGFHSRLRVPGPCDLSPYFPAKEWEEARRTLPEDVFRQEYMAEFLEDSAGVFRGVDGCLLTDLGFRSEDLGVGTAGSGPWEVLTAEMKRYEYEIGPAGQVSYAAPSGYHDDRVMALALGVWGCRTFGVEPGRMLRLGGDRGRRSEDGER